MNPNHWLQTGGQNPSDQQCPTNTYREPKSDKVNCYNMEGIRQNAPNVNFMQSLCATHRNLMRDPRLRNRMPSNLNSFNAYYMVNQIQASKSETQALSNYPADYQSTFSPFVNPNKEKLPENNKVDYQKSLHLMQSYQFFQDMHKKHYINEQGNGHLLDSSYQNTPNYLSSCDIEQERCKPSPNVLNNQLPTTFAHNSNINYNSEADLSNSTFQQNKMLRTEIYHTALHSTDIYGNHSSYQSIQQNSFSKYHKENEIACQPTVHSINIQDSSKSEINNEKGSSPSIISDGNSQLNSEFTNKSTGHDSSRSINQGCFPRRDKERSPTKSFSHFNAQRSRSRSRSRQRKCRSRSQSRTRSTSKSKSRHRSRSRSKSRSRYRSKSRSRSRSRSTSKCRSKYRSRSRSTSRSKYRSRSRSSSKCRSKYRSRSRSTSKCRSKYRSRSRSTSKCRSKYRSRSRSTSKCRSKYRSRSRSISKSKGRYRSRSRSKSRAGYRSRSRSRSLSRNHRQDSSRSYSYGRRERVQEREGSTFKRMRDKRQKLIEKWRMNNCDTQDEMQKRLQEIFQMNPDEILEEENKVWIRSAPANCYYERDPSDLRKMRATPRLEKLCEKFKYELLERGNRVRQSQTLKCPSPPKPKQKLCKHKSQACSSSSESDGESDETDDVNDMIEELQRKQNHPYRLHPELWYNDPGEMNDGPLCRCSAKARRSGIRHGFYAGENRRFYCDVKSNNADSLYHYRITISPPTNFLTRTPTIINYDDHEFIFEGFSLISHYPIQKLPTCKVIRFNIEYIILYVEEKLPENFCIQELDLFYNYLFKEILELVDFELLSSEFPDSCPQFHFMPRFVRELPENGRELLPMCEILKYLLDSNKRLIEDDALDEIHRMTNSEWQNFADLVKGMVVTNPGMKPCSLRVDQLDRDTDEDHKRNSKTSMERGLSGDRFSQEKDIKKAFNDNESLSKVEENFWEGDTKSSIQHLRCTDFETDSKKNSEKRETLYPEIVHFGIRPPQLSYAGNPEYQKAWRKYVKFRHLLANMPKPTVEDKQKLAAKENRLHSMRAHSKMKRDVTVTVSSKGFFLTGLMCDVVQHAMLIPVLVCHLRFHRSLLVLEEKIGYQFKNRFLLQLALTHPSYRENFGTNSDHARNSLTNCGIRQPKYGDRRIHYMNTRKRGINTLISIMSRFGNKNETQSNIYHNERLEFLGDAVVEFITSIHLFHIFRDLEEGGLATYRAALVQNQHLAVLAKKLNLDEFMLYAHGSDLCHDLELKHAMANCFEALMGALFLDGGIEAADHVFGNTLYGDEEDCLDIWFNYPPHPLQEQEPLGDRKWIPQFPLLQKLTEFEETTGIEFKHIRLLARAFTDRSVGYTNLTLGSNQRMEFLGDSVLQLIASEYLYKYFPEHHEGHLSVRHLLLRSSLVNNKTQSVVCDDLGMTKYAVYANPKVELKVKDRADLLEAFLGALYVDNGLEICQVFCDVCFFPRLQIFIMNQDWNDPKSKLQQCCLTLRTMDNVEPDIPIYKVVECKGPTNTRVYTVAVYFRNKRLAKATGHSIQQAEMNAAQKAMETSGPLFPQLDHQKRVIAKSLKTQKWPNRSSWSSESVRDSPDRADFRRQSPNSD